MDNGDVKRHWTVAVEQSLVEIGVEAGDDGTGRFAPHLIRPFVTVSVVPTWTFGLASGRGCWDAQ